MDEDNRLLWSFLTSTSIANSVQKMGTMLSWTDFLRSTIHMLHFDEFQHMQMQVVLNCTSVVVLVCELQIFEF